MGRVVPVVCGHDVAPRVCQWLKRNAGNFTPLHALQWRGPGEQDVRHVCALRRRGGTRRSLAAQLYLQLFFSFPDAKLS
jgi:hypothetical protein